MVKVLVFLYLQFFSAMFSEFTSWFPSLLIFISESWILLNNLFCECQRMIILEKLVIKDLELITVSSFRFTSDDEEFSLLICRSGNFFAKCFVKCSSKSV